MPNSPKKILIVGPAWIGDMIMAQTPYKLIKQNNPEAIIDVIAPKWTHTLLQHMPEINRAIATPLQRKKLDLKKRYQLGKELRQYKYDQAILLPNSLKSALIPFFAKIKKRTGWRGEMRYGLLNDLRILDKNKYPLMIERFAALGIPKGSPLPKKLPWPKLQIDQAIIDNTIAKLKLQTQKPILALCPGAEYGPAKRWPTNYFAQIALQKIADNWQVWIFGGPNDQDIANEIQQQTNNQCINLTGKTSLTEAIALLATSTLVLTNDTGLMHIAAALERKLIVLYGSSSPGFTPPLSKNAIIISLNLPCSPCFERQCPLQHFKCMQDLKPERVINAINKSI